MSSIRQIVRRICEFVAYTDYRLDLFHYLLMLLFIAIFVLCTSVLYTNDFSTHGNRTNSTVSDRSWPLWSKGKAG